MNIIDFEITQHGYTFKDAIVLQDGETMTDAELAAMKQARFDAWYTIITTPVNVVWQVDENGDQILDDHGNPIPVEG